MSRRLRPRLRVAAWFIAVAALGACGSPVGNGVGPVSIGLAAGSGTEVTAQGVTRVYQCFTGSVTATLYFSDGSTGDFTDRVKWSSSNTGVIRVSNGDIAAADGSGFYVAGTLIPVTAGNATIIADYSGLSMQMAVSAGVPSDFTILRNDQTQRTPVTAASLGVGTAQQFSVSAITDGVRKNVSDFARWTIGGSIATVTRAGTVSARGIGGPTPLTASFLTCDNTVSADISVADISGIEIVPEFGSDPLLLGNSERINVLADLDDGTRQDVSLQADLSATDTNIADFLSGAGGDILNPITTGSVTVQATLNDTYTAVDRVVDIVSSTLTAISVTPASAVLRAGSDGTVPFKATGVFGNGQSQDVTRSVSWAVTDTTLASISNDKADAGVATPGASFVGETTVTATPNLTDSTADIDSAMLTVDSTLNPATP